MVLATAAPSTPERASGRTLDAAAAQPTLKGNWREIAALSRDGRQPDRLRAHYELEKILAARLMQAGSADRGRVYGEVYGELFASLADHPQNTRKTLPIDATAWQLSLLRRIVPAGASFAEVGAGDAKVSLGLCDHCSETVAIDVSDAVLGTEAKPANFRFVTIDGLHMPFEADRFDFVYSNQLMEHLHPEDALVQLAEILRILKPGGTYLCITPNRNTGPHDISKYYDTVPTGFHLKEYTYRELSRLFLESGFASTAALWKKGRWHLTMPSWVGVALEELVAHLFPRSRPVTQRMVRNALGINMLGRKA